MNRPHPTPGPWQADEVTDTVFSGHIIIAECSGPPSRFPALVGEQSANARLIAAAPDLLAALHQLLAQTVDSDLAHSIALTQGRQQARTAALAAIQKATPA